MDRLNPTLNVALDIVLLTFQNGFASVYLNKDQGKYALPGILLKETESIHEGFKRILNTKVLTSVSTDNIKVSKSLPIKGDVDRDSRGRVISIPMIVIVRHVEIDNNWYNLDNVIFNEQFEFKFDHQQIFETSYLELMSDLSLRTMFAGLVFTSRQLKEIEVYFNQIKDDMTLSNLLKKYSKYLQEVTNIDFYETEFQKYHVQEGRGRPSKLYICKENGK